MKSSSLKYLSAVLVAGLLNLNTLNASALSAVNDDKDKLALPQDTVTTNKGRAKRGVNEVGQGAKSVGKGTKDLAVSGAKATGKGAKKAGKAVKRTTKKGVEKVDKEIN